MESLLWTFSAEIFEKAFFLFITSGSSQTFLFIFYKKIEQKIYNNFDKDEDSLLIFNVTYKIQ